MSLNESSSMSRTRTGKLGGADHVGDFNNLVRDCDYDRNPERRLWCEVIFRAYWDMTTYLRERNYYLYHHALTAHHWIHYISPHTELETYSFEWAAHVGYPNSLTASALISKLRKMFPRSPGMPFYTESSYVDAEKMRGRIVTKRTESQRRKRFLERQEKLNINNINLEPIEIIIFPPIFEEPLEECLPLNPSSHIPFLEDAPLVF